VGSLTPANDGNVHGIGALLTVNGDGSSGEDVLNVDDTGDTADNSGTLTDVAITGLGMSGTISYGTIERLAISLGSGADTFTIISTHNGDTGGTIETTTLSTGAGADLIHIEDVSDILVVNGEAGPDTVNLNGTGAGSQSTLNGDEGEDLFNLKTIRGATTVNGGIDADTVNVGSKAAGTVGDASNNSDGTVDNIGALLTINGGEGASDTLNVDDTGETDPNAGVLTGTAIIGLDMVGSIIYGSVELLDISFGSGVDTFTVESTHTGTTNLHGNDGGDIFSIRTIDGPTNVSSGNGADTINVGSNAQGDSTTPDKNSSGLVNGISALLTLTGGGATGERDLVTVDDTSDSVANTGILTNNRLTGLGMGSSDQSVVTFRWVAELIRSPSRAPKIA
jgi:hypothetical protein